MVGEVLSHEENKNAAVELLKQVPTAHRRVLTEPISDSCPYLQDILMGKLSGMSYSVCFLCLEVERSLMSSQFFVNHSFECSSKCQQNTRICCCIKMLAD